MTRDYLLTLLDFHYWARDRVLAAAEALSAGQYTQPLGGSFASVRETLNHLYLAEWVWHERLRGTSPRARPDFDIPGVRELRERWTTLERDLRPYVTDATDQSIRTVIPYRLFNGMEGGSTLWQIVAHLTNHGSYHRGQVTTLLRQLGAQPPESTDMITFFREQHA